MWIKTRDVRFDRLWLVACRRKLLKCNSVKSRRTIFFLLLLAKEELLSKSLKWNGNLPCQKREEFRRNFVSLCLDAKIAAICPQCFCTTKKKYRMNQQTQDDEARTCDEIWTWSLCLCTCFEQFFEQKTNIVMPKWTTCGHGCIFTRLNWKENETSNWTTKFRRLKSQWQWYRFSGGRKDLILPSWSYYLPIRMCASVL